MVCALFHYHYFHDYYFDWVFHRCNLYTKCEHHTYICAYTARVPPLSARRGSPITFIVQLLVNTVSGLDIRLEEHVKRRGFGHVIRLDSIVPEVILPVSLIHQPVMKTKAYVQRLDRPRHVCRELLHPREPIRHVSEEPF